MYPQRIDRLCAHCHKPISVQPNQAQRGEGKYCSLPCRDLGRRRPLAERLWEKVDRSGGPESCWPHHTKERDTYGHIYYLTDEGVRRHIGTHCAAWLVTHGYLPSDLMVLHQCGYKPCCNPNHLYLGNARMNALDAIAEGVWRGNTQLDEGDIKAIRLLHGVIPHKDIAQKFDVAQGTISDIITGKTHKDTGGPIKTDKSKVKTHCRKGHQLTEDNITLSHGGTARNCRICYMEANRIKARRRLANNRDLINQQRRARRASSVKRFTPEECAAIATLHPEHSYRAIAAMFPGATYGTVERIVKGTYTGSKHLH